MADNPAYIRGTPLDDVLTGTGLNESIEGLLGNDRMYGMGGADQLWGAGGDDLYDGGDGFDYAQFYKSNMWIQVDLAIKGPQNTNEGQDTFVSIEGILGSPYNDVFRGDAGANELQGADGNDFLDGRGGDDFLVGGAGADEIHGGDGEDSIHGGDGDDRLFGDAGDDTFWVSAGNDVVDGGAGADTLVFLQSNAGISIDLAVSERQEVAYFVYLTVRDVENVTGTSIGDNIAGNAKDNLLVGGRGDDFIDGRGGYDTVRVNGYAEDFDVSWTVDGWRIADRRTSAFSDGVDMVKNIEWLQFGGSSGWALGDGMTQLVGGLLRLTGKTAVADDLSRRLDTGVLTPAQALAEVIAKADATTSVATMAYQFFTGRIPSQIGIDFLVSPTGPNASNLNSDLYAKFDTVNRYINFAMNLGKYGEAKDSFAAAYGGLTLFEATRKAYGAIFGGTPTDAKVAQLLDGRVAFLASFSGDPAEGIGTKAAMVGFLLAAAATENLGVIARSNDAWLTDLADGAAPFAVNLIDPANGYYKADFIHGG